MLRTQVLPRFRRRNPLLRYLIFTWTAPYYGTQTTHRALEAATGELLGTVALGDDMDIGIAVRAGNRALASGPWGDGTPVERAEMMRAFAASLATRAAETSALVSREKRHP